MRWHIECVWTLHFPELWTSLKFGLCTSLKSRLNLVPEHLSQMSGVTEGPAKCLRLANRQAAALLSESNQSHRSCHTWKAVILERKPTNRELGLEQTSCCLDGFKLVSHLGTLPYPLDGVMSRVYFLIQTYTHHICNVVLV